MDTNPVDNTNNQYNFTVNTILKRKAINNRCFNSKISGTCSFENIMLILLQGRFSYKMKDIRNYSTTLKSREQKGHITIDTEKIQKTSTTMLGTLKEISSFLNIYKTYQSEIKRR